MYTREVLEDMFTAPTDGTYYFGMSVATHSQYNNFRLFGLNVDYVADNDLKAFTIMVFKKLLLAMTTSVL